MTIYYIYAYISERTRLPYYIGKGKDNRAFAYHKKIAVPKDKSRIVFLESNLTELGAFALERRYIRWYGRRDNKTGILLNRTDGGEGVSGLSGEARDKMSKTHKGKIVSDETKLKQSQSHIGQCRSHSEETKEKMRQAALGKIISEEQKDKIRKANTGRIISEETRKKLSAAMQRRWDKKRGINS